MTTEGYVLLDLYDPDGMSAYAMMQDISHTIRDYEVNVTEKENEYVIEVSAHIV